MDKATYHSCAFTFHLWSQEELNNYRIEPHEAIRRYVWQVELTEQGLPHIQGYIELKPKKNWRAKFMKQWVGLGTDRAHLSSGKDTKGTPKDNYIYCTKADSRWMQGEQFGDWDNLDEETKKNGWSTVVERIKEGAHLRQLYDEFPRESLTCSKGINQAIQALARPLAVLDPEQDNIQFCWIFGPSGTGKTRSVWDWAQLNNKQLYIKDPTSKWWCGFDPNVHDAVLVDDYRPNSQLPYDELLRLCDLYPLRVEPKGGSMMIRPKVVFITSNYAPWDMFRGIGEAYPDSAALVEDTCTPLIRRLTQWNMCWICQKQQNESRTWSKTLELEAIRETAEELDRLRYTVEEVQDEEELPDSETQDTIPVATGTQEHPIVLEDYDDF